MLGRRDQEEGEKMNILLGLLFLTVIVYLAMVYTTYLLFKRQGIEYGSRIMYFIFPAYSFIAHINVSIKLFIKGNFKTSGKMIVYSVTKFDISVTVFTTMITENIAQFEAYGASELILSKNKEESIEKETKSEFIKRIIKEFSKPLVLGENIREIYT